MSTTIQISDRVKKTLEKMRVFQRETYNEVIENLLEDQMEINKRTKKELEERKKSADFVCLETVERELGV